MTEEDQKPLLAEPKVRAARRKVCDACEFKNKTVPVCNECKCIIVAKTMLAGAECPKGKWPA
jgi:hypothetical protein